MSDNPGQILFDKFEILDCLKKDHFGGVFAANHIFLNKKIILKSLNTSLIDDPEVIERFKREAKLLARLDHPNIIRVLDFGIYNQFFYISFEYFESNSLRHFLLKDDLSIEQKIKLTWQLLEGLNFAHINDIIHRDLKPENIFVDNNLQLKIGDFGLAFSINENYVTSQTSIVGTPSYMSPEQIQGEKLTEQSDLFSIGLVILELFTGTCLFASNDINQTINKIISFSEESIDLLVSDLPLKITALIKSLLKKNKSERLHSTADALKILGHEITKSSSTRKRTTAVSVLVIISSIIVIIFFMYIPINQIPNQSTGNENNITLTEQLHSKETVELTDEIQNNLLESETERNFKPVEKLVIGNDIETVNEIEKKIYGEFNLVCFPWAYIFIDSIEIETTPLQNNLILETGLHKIKLINPNYPEFESAFIVYPGELTDLKVNLDTLVGHIKFSLFPWGNVTIDSVEIGQSPFHELVKVFPGQHKLQFSNPQFENFQKDFVIGKNDTLSVIYNFVTGILEWNNI